MAKVQEFLNGQTGVFLDALSDEHIVHQASKQFVDRGYLTTYKPYYLASKRGLWILQGASMLFALSYVASLLVNLLPSFVPYWGVVGLSFVGLYFVEIGKKLTLTRSIDSILKRYSDYFFYVLAVVFLAVSIYTSVSGLMQFSKQQTDKSVGINANYATKKDSIEKYYNAQIKTERTALNEYKRQVSYKGKIDMTNPTNRQTILDYEKRITSFNTQKTNALNDTKNDNSLILNENRNKTNIVSSEMFIVALINEIFIIVCLWFNRDYLSKVFLSENDSLNVSNDSNETPPTIQRKIFAVKRNCIHCGESYEIGHKKQKFCSNLCRMDYHNAKRQRESTA
jgi:hypothetical protein